MRIDIIGFVIIYLAASSIVIFPGSSAASHLVIFKGNTIDAIDHFIPITAHRIVTSIEITVSTWEINYSKDDILIYDPVTKKCLLLENTIKHDLPSRESLNLAMQSEPFIVWDIGPTIPVKRFSSGVQPPVSPPQISIVTSISSSISIPEGNIASFQIKLSRKPELNVTISVTKVSGDADIRVHTGASLLFTTSNWNILQKVTLGAEEDTDTENGNSTIKLSASGINDKSITAHEIDNDKEYYGTISGNLHLSIGGHEELNITNAAVALEGTPYTATTDSNGNFILENIPPGTYILNISAPKLIPIMKSISLGENQELGLGSLEMTILTQENLEQAVMDERFKYDPNKDGKIGLDSVIFWLQVLSGQRSME